MAHGKHDKVRIFKLRRRKHYQKRQGHRQLVHRAADPGDRRLNQGADHGTEKKAAALRRTGAIPAQDGRKGFGGELISAGSIIVRQRGAHPPGSIERRRGQDHTLFALVDGHVSFGTKERIVKHTVSVTPA